MAPNKVSSKSSVKHQQKLNKSLLKELPYYQLQSSLVIIHGQFNNSLSSELLTKRDIEKLPSLYNLDLFSLNKIHDNNLTADDNLLNQRIFTRYFSPHSLKQHMNRLTKDTLESSFTIFHNNIRSLRRNLETLVTHYLHELNMNFNIIGVTETKITNSNESADLPSIPGYVFEHPPTPLACGGAGLFIDKTLEYIILETTSNESFQALWIEIRFLKKKNVICGIVYRQHNSPENFLNILRRQ